MKVKNVSSVNKVILVGNLGKDPEIRATQSGGKLANFSIATSKKVNGEEKTEWHRLVAFNKTAEVIEQYVKKGSKLYVEGELQTRKWTDKDGADKYTTEILVNQMTMLDSKASSGPSSSEIPF